MTFRRLLSALLLAAAFAGPACAQTPLGQPTLEEAKVQIWCATARFVYDDAGRPHLKSTVQCADLAGLAASLRPDSLRVYSLLYQPIEGRGSIYQGKKDNPARLDALVKAIVQKLKSSPARRRDPARLARLTALETALVNYAQNGTPPGDVPAAMQPEAPDTTASTVAPGPAELAEAQAAPPAPRAAAPETTTDLLLRFAAPLALILSILGLVLYGMLRVTLGQWRRQQRRETLTARQAASAAQTAATETAAAVADSAARLKRAEALVLAAVPEPATAPAAAAVPAQLSAAQRQEVERLVSQRVDEELHWLRQQLPEIVAAALAASATPPPPRPADESAAEAGIGPLGGPETVV